MPVSDNKSSEAWKMECLARHICALPSLAERRLFIHRVQLRNGKAVADRLGEMVKQEWEKRSAK